MGWQPKTIVEIEWFDQLFVHAATNGIVDGKQGVQFLLRSGRSREELRTVWEIASNDSTFLTRKAFYKAMRLIQLLQNGVTDLGPTTLWETMDVMLPTLPRIQWAPTQEESSCFEALFLAHEFNGAVGGKEGVQFLMQSGRPRDELRTVWEIASNDSTFLTRKAFYKAMRLIQLVQHGYPLVRADDDCIRPMQVNRLPLFECRPLHDQLEVLETYFQSIAVNTTIR